MYGCMHVHMLCRITGGWGNVMPPNGHKTPPSRFRSQPTKGPRSGKRKKKKDAFFFHAGRVCTFQRQMHPCAGKWQHTTKHPVVRVIWDVNREPTWSSEAFSEPRALTAVFLDVGRLVLRIVGKLASD